MAPFPPALRSEAWECSKLPPVREFALVLLTAKVGSAAADAATSLKLTEYGMPKVRAHAWTLVACRAHCALRTRCHLQVAADSCI
jgi:hypothetical protein